VTKHIITDGEFHLEATGDINLRSTTGSINMFGVGDVMNEGNASFAGDVTISGNLTVLGTPTTVNSTDTLIKDNIIELNVGEVGAGVSSLYSGIQIDRGSLTDVAIRWNETTDKWQITNDGTTYLNIAAASGIFLENVVEDTTPQLGGDLDVTGTSFVTTSNGNITFAPNGTGDVLPGTDSTYDFGATATRWANIYSDALDATSITGTLQTAAQANITSLGTLSGLGVTGTVTVTGQLDIDNLSVNGNTVTATTGDITLTPATGSAVNLDDTNITADGGVFTITGQIDVDNININGNTISSTDANGNIVLTPNGTGATQGVVNINTNSAMNLPAGTTAERPAAFGSAGDFRFNTSTANIEYSDGGSWTSLIGTSTNIISQGNSDVTVSDAGVGTITMTVDGGTTATFDVDGLDIVTGDTYQINGTSVLSSTTLGSGVTASSLTSVGTISSGTWSGSFGAVSGANLTSLTAANISSGNLASGVYSYAVADAQNFAYKISFLDTTLNSSGNFQQLFESGAGEFTYNPNTDTLTVGTISVGAITGTSIQVTSGDIIPATDSTIQNVGTAADPWTNMYAAQFHGQATSAQYADLAENYLADADYEEGTVLDFGGNLEITQSTTDHSRKIAGVVSLHPASLMNSALEGDHVTAVALQGRVPVKVQGTIRKGDMMVSAGNGRARAEADPKMGSVLGKALEDFDGTGEGIIEVVVGRV